MSLETLYHCFPIIQSTQLSSSNEDLDHKILPACLIFNRKEKTNKKKSNTHVSANGHACTHDDDVWRWRYKPVDTTRKEKIFIYVIFI